MLIDWYWSQTLKLLNGMVVGVSVFCVLSLMVVMFLESVLLSLGWICGNVPSPFRTCVTIAWLWEVWRVTGSLSLSQSECHKQYCIQFVKSPKSSCLVWPTNWSMEASDRLVDYETKILNSCDGTHSLMPKDIRALQLNGADYSMPVLEAFSIHSAITWLSDQKLAGT